MIGHPKSVGWHGSTESTWVLANTLSYQPSVESLTSGFFCYVNNGCLSGLRLCCLPPRPQACRLHNPVLFYLLFLCCSTHWAPTPRPPCLLGAPRALCQAASTPVALLPLAGVSLPFAVPCSFFLLTLLLTLCPAQQLTGHSVSPLCQLPSPLPANYKPLVGGGEVGAGGQLSQSPLCPRPGAQRGATVSSLCQDMR